MPTIVDRSNKNRRDASADMIVATLAVQRAQEQLRTAALGPNGVARDWRELAEAHLRDAQQSLTCAMRMLQCEETA